MNNYETKKLARIERLEERAAAKRQEADDRANSNNIKTVIGMGGEPVKIGHHSEGRHRRLLERADNDMRKSYEASQSAREYDRRAEAAASNTAVSSDDPEALVKLREKAEKLERLQEQMKRINAAFRKFKKDPASIDSIELSDKERDYVVTFQPKSWEQDIPFPSFRLTNNNAVIKTTKKRIEELERKTDAVTNTQEYDGFKVVENVEENRIQIVHDEKPDEEVRGWLKSHGLRWSRFHGAWQRHLNRAGKSASQLFVERASEAVAEC